MKQTPSTVRVCSTSSMSQPGPSAGTNETPSPSEDDVTQRERTEALRWRSVFDNSPLGVVIMDTTGRVLATNVTYQQMLGYSESELQQISLLEVTHEDYREYNLVLFTELLEGKRDQYHIEKQYWRKDGTLIWVRNNVTLIPATEETPRLVLALSEDITERKRAEEALELTEEQARLVLNSAAEGIFGCDSQGTCLFCNPAAVRLLGYENQSELLGKNMHRLEHHTRKDGRMFPLEECPIYMGFLENRGVHIDDDIFWRKDGSSFPVEYWSHPLVKDGVTVGAVVTFFDISERRRASDELRKSEERKRTLLEINNAIINNLTQEALFASVYDAIRSVIAFDRAAFLFYQSESRTLKLVSMASAGESEFFRVGKEYGLDESKISAWVLEHQEVVTRGDLEEEPRSLGEQRLVQEGIQSYCVVPL
ncbi:MAG TPA: PAS domain S-box protein, partial [Pyrinomonadaceae bacterium]|nr:PAS domain S-box protein [Pyrinomonadaceae bacterium]